MGLNFSQRKIPNEGRRKFVSAEAAIAAFKGVPRIEPERFRQDVDAVLDADLIPRP